MAMLLSRKGISPAVVCLHLLLLLLVTSVAGAEYVKYKDPKRPIQERVEDLVSRMTLEEKIGQMTQIERANASSSVIQKYFVGTYAAAMIHLNFCFVSAIDLDS
jgi:beta-glucosidase